MGKDFPVNGRRKLHHKQQPCRALHPTSGERAEELAFLQQPQDGTCRRSLPLRRVHMQASRVFNPGIPQEILYRDNRRQPRLRKAYALNHRHQY